ncbi:MAG: hypothetical protein K2Q27_05290 [Novosphingobium sp.]|nr:hypothetical protein [Novosphingobium sp.]
MSKQPATLSRPATQRAATAALAIGTVGAVVVAHWGEALAPMIGQAAGALVVSLLAGPWIGGRMFDQEQARQKKRGAEAPPGQPSE